MPADVSLRSSMPAGPLSSQAYGRSRELFPGGVNSPVRAFGAVGGTPRFVDRAAGPYIWDVDGTRYIDYVGSWGPMILGHAHPAVLEAIAQAAHRGTSYGAPTLAETQLAEEVRRRLPSMEVMRFVSSGTEAAMAALRAARGFTGRDLIVKCAGCYHGHADGLLVEAGSGAATFGSPSSLGVPASVAAGTLVVPFNDLAAAEAVFAAHPGAIACFAVEPVAGNMGLVPPEPTYLQGLRDLCDRHGSLLLMDEVMTGFRLDLGGAQTRYRVRPDLTCLGKIFGGGLPAAAYGGRADVMRCVSPDGRVYQGGTLSGNPLAMAAGLATLRQLGTQQYEQLESLGSRLEHGLQRIVNHVGDRLPMCVQRVGSMITLYFTHGPVRCFADALRSDTGVFAEYFHRMLAAGVWLPPSQFEAWFISLAHDESLIDQTIAASEQAILSMVSQTA